MAPTSQPVAEWSPVLIFAMQIPCHSLTVVVLLFFLSLDLDFVTDVLWSQDGSGLEVYRRLTGAYAIGFALLGSCCCKLLLLHSAVQAPD